VINECEIGMRNWFEREIEGMELKNLPVMI